MGIKMVDSPLAKSKNAMVRVGFTLKIIPGWVVNLVEDTLEREPLAQAASRINFLMGIRMATTKTAITLVVAHGLVSWLAEKPRAGLLMDVTNEEMTAATKAGGNPLPVEKAGNLINEWLKKYSLQPPSLMNLLFEQGSISTLWFDAIAFQGTSDKPLLYSKQVETFPKMPTLKRGRSESPVSSSDTLTPRYCKLMTVTEKRALQEAADAQQKQQRQLEKKMKFDAQRAEKKAQAAAAAKQAEAEKKTQAAAAAKQAEAEKKVQAAAAAAEQAEAEKKVQAAAAAKQAEEAEQNARAVKKAREDEQKIQQLQDE